MTSAIRPPATVFCRLGSLLNQQTRLAAALESLRQLKEKLEVEPWTTPEVLEPERVVEKLTRVLAEHIDEAEDYLSQVAQGHPNLLPVIVDLKADHAALSEAATELGSIAGDRARWLELPLRINRILARVAVHRETEAALVRDVLEPSTNVA